MLGEIWLFYDFSFRKKKKQQPGFNMGAIRGILKFESSVTPQEDLPKFALELNKHITANKKKKREYSKTVW